MSLIKKETLVLGRKDKHGHYIIFLSFFLFKCNIHFNQCSLLIELRNLIPTFFKGALILINHLLIYAIIFRFKVRNREPIWIWY